MIESIDYFFLSIGHALECGFLTFIFKFITILGEKGILFFLIAIACMLFPKTRKFGVCLFGAVACGALITNIILKDAIARDRPFVWNDTYHQWWLAVGSPMEDGYAFPSGHATAAAAGCTAICLMKGKKWIVPSAIWVFLMMCARTYLMAHHPTDVFVGAIVGIISGFIAYYITIFIFQFLEKNSEKKWADICLHFSIPVLDRFAVNFLEESNDIILKIRSMIPELPEISNITKFEKKFKREPASYDSSEADPDAVDESDDAPKHKAHVKESNLSSFSFKSVKFPTGSSTYVGKHEKK